MFFKKAMKRFLMLGVIFFSILGVLGCSDTTGANVKATYIETSYQSGIIDGQFNIVDNPVELANLLKNDIPEKYNDSFFQNNVLLTIKVVESSLGNRSAIESYVISDKTLNVYVKTIQYGEDCAMGCWWHILELSKEEVETFEYVKIFKNGEEIRNGNKLTILSKIYYMDVIDMCSSITFKYEKPNYGYISLNRASSYIYNFNSEKVYELVSMFNNIPIFPVETMTKREELDKLMTNSIIIEVSYSYEIRNNNNNDAIVYFYILENGILLFEDNRKINLYYSDVNVINFNELKNQIIQIGDSM